MDESDLFTQLILERIAMILQEEILSKKEKSGVCEKAESVINNLLEGEQEVLNEYLQEIFDQMALEEELLYRQGLIDAVRIMKWIKRL